MNRALYPELVQWKNSGKRKPLLLKGARQVGKTWLINEFGRNEFNQIHIFNFQEFPGISDLFRETLNPDKLLTELEISFSINIDRDRDLVFFDEIQECPEAVSSLKYFCEKLPKLALCCAGSHIGISSLHTSFPVGKVDFLTLYPMSFHEFLDNLDKNLADRLHTLQQNSALIHKRLLSSLNMYYAVGGMPEAVRQLVDAGDLNESLFRKIRLIQEQILTGYRSDFAKHSGKINANHISRVFDNIPEQIVKNTDYSVSRYRFKDVIPGYSKYSQLSGPIEWLIRTGLCYPVSVIETPGIPLKAHKKENMFKLLFFDTGLLNAMNNLSLKSILDQDFGTYKGYLAENFTAQELMASGAGRLYSWTGRMSEIEFLLERNNEVIPLEVKSGRRINRAKSLQVFIEKYKPSHSYLLSMNPFSEEGAVIKLPLYGIGSLTGRL